MKSFTAALLAGLFSLSALASAKYTFIGTRTFVPTNPSHLSERMINKSIIALNLYDNPVVYSFVSDKYRGFVTQRKLSDKLIFDRNSGAIVLVDESSKTVCGHLNESATGIANVMPTGACVVIDEISMKADGSAELTTFIVTKISH